MTDQLTPTSIADMLGDHDLIDQVNVWLDRGDGIAVYENKALDSANIGQRKFLSFGSQDAQVPGDPPKQYPDFEGAEPGWKYLLTGTYHDARLDYPRPKEMTDEFIVAQRIVDGFREGAKVVAEHVSRWEVKSQAIDAENMANGVHKFSVTVSFIDDDRNVFDAEIRSWSYDRKVDVIGPFEWFIRGRYGSDVNLGACKVTTHNIILAALVALPRED